MKWHGENDAYKLTTKSELFWIKWYFDKWLSSDDSIYTAYKNPSQYKMSAYEDLKNQAEHFYPWMTGYSVISHNSNFFTVGYEFEDNETGELCFMYVTHTKKRYCTLSDLEEATKQYTR